MPTTFDPDLDPPGLGPVNPEDPEPDPTQPYPDTPDEPLPATPERILALDVGNRRIGIAISDPLGILALPLLTLHCKSPHLDLKSIGRLLRRHSITDLVIGDPVHLSGEVSPQTRKTRDFADQIAQLHPQVRLHRLDERLTTAEAHTLLDRSGRPVRTRADRLQRERTIDQIAAVLLLDAFLSHRSPRLLPPPPDF